MTKEPEEKLGEEKPCKSCKGCDGCDRTQCPVKFVEPYTTDT